ncbi:glycosyltransferase [Flavobacterium sp. GSB-24]|jgi:glycosyltransferase involved in cell wall biosynthesis|uniref:glycosyltransferase n=1 Tax=Flavobacterium sp. GSB-24 TaxID=2994319 RepID=UPI00249118FE|nr:glycosyltransferase [Flavobacterium sp. GSB-24]BDU24159.1 glycosyl transferase [Flavobacterium sp. GSB-24]
MNKILVLIPYYNNIEGLLKSLKSIDADENLDVLIVDDGSTIKLEKELIDGSFKANGKILYKISEKNEGIESALNHGLKIAQSQQYQYIARLDCGDVCLGKRFQIQSQFLEKNPEIKIVGSNVLAVDCNDKFLYAINLPLNHEDIEKKMYFNSMLIHPAIMFSSSILDTIGYYPTQYKSAEDYAFFFTISKYYKMANIAEYLTQIEINEKGISLQKRKQQVLSRITIIKQNFYFGFYPIYGLIRNYILLILPYRFILFLKKVKK